MGYTTDFVGSFKTDKPVDENIFKLVNGLAGTRRMKREDLPKEYGVEGEFYFEDDGDYGQSRNPKNGKIVNYNQPPSTQPSLWLQWMFEKDMQTIVWDGSEKFYCYVGWLEYLINRILKPSGYVVNGKCEYQGEDSSDRGEIIVENNVIYLDGHKAPEKDYHQYDILNNFGLKPSKTYYKDPRKEITLTEEEAKKVLVSKVDQIESDYLEEILNYFIFDDITYNIED